MSETSAGAAPVLDTFMAQTPEQAERLLNLSSATTLATVMTREVSASESAALSGVTLKQAHHRLTRLLYAGLIQIVEERPRGGRAIKRYRAVARAFLVPFALTRAATRRELLASLHRPFLEAYLDAHAAHTSDQVLIRLDDHDLLSFSFSPDEPKAGYGTVRTTKLRPEAMRELQHRLRELAAWVSASEGGDDPRATPCILALLFTPGEVEGA